MIDNTKKIYKKAEVNIENWIRRKAKKNLERGYQEKGYQMSDLTPEDYEHKVESEVKKIKEKFKLGTNILGWSMAIIGIDIK